MVRRIIELHQPSKEEIHLEIGAGRGELTSSLAEKVGFLYAVEFDRELIPSLKEKMKERKNVRIIEGDILKIDIRKLVSEEKRLSRKLRVIGNLPYNIATKIIAHILSYRDIISDLTFTLQKELAERMVAKPRTKAYGELSLFIQYHLEPKVCFFIPKRAFTPPPKVENVLIRFRVREEPLVKVADEKEFFRLIRISFAQRRKTIENNLIPYLRLSRDEVRRVLEKAGIPYRFRAEEIDIAGFSRLLDTIKQNRKEKKGGR